MLIDYHIHTAMSGDAKGEFEQYVKIARHRGLSEIGFSDHFHPERPDYSMRYERLVEYVKKVQSLKEKTDFPIKLGIEVDFTPSIQSKITRVLSANRFDYIIGSVHFINGWGFDDPKYIAEYQKWKIEELYCTYFDLVQQSAKSKLFDIIGHADLIKKFGYKPKIGMTELYRRTAEVFKENKVCVEVNTGGLRAPCKEIYPDKEFLRICFEVGVPITLGSDSHTPEHVGADFNRSLQLIESVGYKDIVSFTNRRRELVEIVHHNAY